MIRAFKSEAGQARYEAAYAQMLGLWGIETEEQWVETSFGESHVIVAGNRDAKPLVLLPGMTVSGAMWACNAKAFADEYCVYALDTMGDFGKNRPTAIPASEDDYGLWLGEVIDALGLGVVSLMGMSFGGWVANVFAQRQPERVRRLILMAPAASFLSLRLGFIMRGVPLLIYPTRGWNDRYMRYPYVHESMTPFAQQAFTQLIELVYLGWKHAKVRVKRYPTVFADEALAKLTMPVMLLLGEEEKIYEPRKAIARAASLLPRFTPMLVPAASHDIAFSQHEIVNREVLSFLAEA